MTKKPSTKRRTPTKKVGIDEIKRQLAAAKLENSNLKRQLSAEPSPLGKRWTESADEADSYTLDNSAGTIEKVDQGEGEQPLYKISVGEKLAFFIDIAEAAEKGELWVDGPRKAIHNPTSISHRYESGEEEIQQGEVRHMKSTGPASEALEDASVIQVDRRYSSSKMQELAFMEEEVEVLIHESTNEKDIPIPCFYNDGISQYFIRGKQQTVKRKFLEQIARCHITIYTQELYKDSQDNNAYRHIPHTTLAYPFQVITDRNPRGADWLRGIQQQGT